MLPPVMELVVVWHPGDPLGPLLGEALVEHFHTTPYSGLIGGAVEVYVRSVGWRSAGGPPRPLPVPGADGDSPRYVAVVPVLGRALADAVNDDPRWREYVEEIARAAQAPHGRFAYFPVTTAANLGTSLLVRSLGGRQRVGHVADADVVGSGSWRRDLVQGLAQFVQGPAARIRVFISHTRLAVPSGAPVAGLTELVREVIADTRLSEFFDAHDLQPGDDWGRALREAAGASVLLALRSDLYPSRAWCQEEVLTAKVAGTPVVIADALDTGEDRGSFLMDHVPRVPIRRQDDPDRTRADVELALGRLVDEALKQALWRRQEELADDAGIEVGWWAPHAPEPVTLAAWLDTHRDRWSPTGTAPLVVLHPDPPLGEPELSALQQVFRLTGATAGLDVVTSRQLAGRRG